MRALVVPLVLAVSALAVDLSAQGARGQGAPRANRALAPAEVIAMLDAYAVVQAQEALQLSDGQYGQFVTRLRRLQETRRRNQQARNKIIQSLRELTAPDKTTTDEGAIRQRLADLREHDQRAAAELASRYDALDEVITVAQQARFRIFEEMLERRKLDLLMRARQANRR